jgi:hypothetical protein
LILIFKPTMKKEVRKMTEATIEKRIQVRCQYSDNMIHVQGIGNPEPTGGNRKYGMATELRVPIELTNWLKGQEPTAKSPASGDQLYIPLRLVRYVVDSHTPCYQLFIEATAPGGDPLNHPMGAVLDMQPLSQPVKDLIAFCEANEIQVDSTDEPYSDNAGEEE